MKSTILYAIIALCVFASCASAQLVTLGGTDPIRGANYPLNNNFAWLTSHLYDRPVSATAPSAGQVYAWSSAGSQWQPTTIDTSLVGEAGNLYFTTARARGILIGSGPISYNANTGVVDCPTCLLSSGTYSNPTWLSLTATGGLISGLGGAALLSVGTGSGDVAAGNHTHTGLYQPVITTGTTSQYFRGDLSLATFPTTWAWSALSGVPSFATVATSGAKADVGLGSVENTALSTWPGSANLTTLGTIGTGLWHGTAIGDSYISSADAWNAKQAAISGAPGTWPSFGGAALLGVGTTTGTVTAGDDARLSNARTPTGPASGALAGNYPSPTLANPNVANGPVVLDSSGNASLPGSLAITKTLLGTTPTNALTLLNSTPAAAGAQQYSPASEWSGNQWVLLTAPTAPTSNAPGAGGACDNGTHYWLVTYINATGETTMGTASAVQTCATAGNLQTEGLTAIPTGPTGTTGRNVYRSKAGAAHAAYTDFFLACASAPCIANNTATTFSDGLADASLGVNPPAANGTGNSQSIGFRSYVVPVQGTTTASSYLGMFYHPPSGGDVLGMSVLPSGNVGIGTTNPSQMLTVGNNNQFTVTFNGQVTAQNPAAVNDSDFQIASFGGGTDATLGNINMTIRVHPSATGANRYVSLTAGDSAAYRPIALQPTSGNVGIGTTGPVSKLHIGVAPTATANYGTLSIGSGAWDGATTGKFVGSASGTSIAVNEVSGYGGDLMNLQVGGVSQFKVTAGGVMTLAGATFVLGGHTCSIVGTVLTCP